MATRPKPGEGSSVSKTVRVVQVSPNVKVTAPYKGPAFTPAEVKRLKSIVELIKPTSKATAKVNAKALKASGVVKPKTDTKTTKYSSSNKYSLDMVGKSSTARADARSAVAERKAAAAAKAEAAAKREYMRTGRIPSGGAGLGIGRTR